MWLIHTKKLAVLAIAVMALAMLAVVPASAHHESSVRLYNHPFRQGLTTLAFHTTASRVGVLDLDSRPAIRVFDHPYAHSDLQSILVLKGNDVFRGPYTKEFDKLYTVVGNQVRFGRPGAGPALGPQAVAYTFAHDYRYLRIYRGAYQRFRNIAYTIWNGRLYRGPYPRLENLVFTSQGDINEILPLLPILADGAY